ncbi:MAG: response regulator transcription factor [Chitinophagaceae bacterium]|nr:response regulator transcription factor [Chitinophagaceae bacterium]
MNIPRLKVLVVDDEESIQKILKHYFKDKHEVFTSNNGQEALTWMYDGNVPDFIIADINMPVINGFDFIEELKSSGFFSHIPLIILSGIDKSDTKIKCLEAGADDFMTKPFNPRELEARLNSIMKRTKLTQSN